MINEVKKTQKQLLIVAISFVVLLIVSVVCLFLVNNKQSALEGADSALRLSAQSGFECEFSEAQKIYPFDEGVLKVTNERVAYLTTSGNEVYSANINYVNPTCYVFHNYAVVCDIGGYGFAMFDEEGMVYSKSTSECIKNATVSDDGLCAVILDSNEAFGQVTVYDSVGNFIVNWISSDSGYPILAEFNDDSSQIAISCLNTNGAVSTSSLKIIALNQNDNYSASDLAIYQVANDDIISSVIYCKDKFFCFSSNSIYAVDNNQLVELQLGFDSLNYVWSVDDKLFIVYSDGVGQINNLAIIDADLSITYDSALGTTINDFYVLDNHVAISVDNRIFVFTSDGNIETDLSVDENVIRIGLIGGNKINVISPTGVHIINY